MSFQFLQFHAACRNRDHLRPNRLPTLNIVSGVSDHQNFLASQFPSNQFPSAFVRYASDAIAILMVIRKSPRAKMAPQIVPPQLQLSAEPYIPSQQPHNRLARIIFQPGDKFADSLARPSLQLVQKMIQPKRIAIKKSREVRRARLQIILNQDLPHQRNIRPPREYDIARRMGKLEFARERFRKRAHSCPSAANKRPIDIKENQANHARISGGAQFEVKRSKVVMIVTNFGANSTLAT